MQPVATHVRVTPSSIPTIISAVGGGYLYYLTRRATVCLVFPILVHAAFDFFGFSHRVGESDASFYMFLYQSVIVLVVLGLYRIIPPASARAKRGAERVSEEAWVGPTS